VFEVPEAIDELGASPYQRDRPSSATVSLPRPDGVTHDWLIKARFLPRFG
jgi:hypothetical protein